MFEATPTLVCMWNGFHLGSLQSRTVTRWCEDSRRRLQILPDGVYWKTLPDTPAEIISTTHLRNHKKFIGFLLGCSFIAFRHALPLPDPQGYLRRISSYVSVIFTVRQGPYSVLWVYMYDEYQLQTKANILSMNSDIKGSTALLCMLVSCTVCFSTGHMIFNNIGSPVTSNVCLSWFSAFSKPWKLRVWLHMLLWFGAEDGPRGFTVKATVWNMLTVDTDSRGSQTPLAGSFHWTPENTLALKGTWN